MRKMSSLALALLASATVLTGEATPVEAAAKPAPFNGRVVEVVNKLPADWRSAVVSGTNWLDQYTGTDLRIVKKCSGKAFRCITIKQGRLRMSGNPVGRSEGTTITVDTWKAKHGKGHRGKWNFATKKFLIAHELGHQRWQPHNASCSNFMYPYVRCNGKMPKLRTTASQRASLAKY